MRFWWHVIPKTFQNYVRMTENETKFERWNWSTDKILMARLSATKTFQGSMLWSQFSAIFANFRRINWRFSQKPILWSQFLQKLAVVWAKNANIFAKFFVENILKNHNIVPRNDVSRIKHEIFPQIFKVFFPTAHFGRVWKPRFYDPWPEAVTEL
jgi:hypothetical protein